MPIGRRLFLISCVAASATACARTTPRPPAPTAVALPADFASWNQEARGILSDGLETLRAFDVFQAFRVSTAAQSSPTVAFGLAETMLAWRDNRLSANGDTQARRILFIAGMTEHFALSYDGLNRLKSITGPISESFVLDGASTADRLLSILPL